MPISLDSCQYEHTKLLELSWVHTRPSSICKHETSFHIPQILERLLYIHLFLNNAIEESSPYIHWVQLLSHRSSKWDDRSNGGVLGNWSKSLIIVFSLFLGESSSHKPCLVFIDTPICSVLNLVYLLGSHYWLPLGLRTISQTSFFMIDWYTSVIASFPTCWLTASSYVEGSS